MKAIVLEQFGSIDNLQFKDLPVPQPQAGEVLVKVVFAAVNPYDRKVIEVYGKEVGVQLPVIPGSELSGIVEATGDGVTGFQPGDAVCGTLRTFGGCYAEYAVVKASDVAKKPGAVSFEAAAAIPVAALTASKAILDEGALKAGETVLIHGASGGIGSMAVQLAKAAGAYVIATGSGKNEQRIKDLGADIFIDYTTQDFTTIAKNTDLVLDTIGGKTQEDSFAVLKQGGRLISLVQPPSGEKAAQHQVYAKMIFGGPDAGRLQQLLQQLADGILKVSVEKVYVLADTKEALRAISTGHRTGKLLLNP
ncbi:NADP-dependent oxidoreductase [Niabella drilacis]|uniref:NADPH:quinone reductase n=1 Tax=Niabella drilacis (strain DSM 25811 / CCM 8410 / CCUG 62505 / LMG 26954 / E90) TaxID=1285928 RepID=A0A1G6U5J5_NIADE|nr:NADP-dependent oxidoreductase [Niabella drilacis]SDD35956.1 NADPH:quinone reductase [Niabella drilacis]